MFKIRQIHNVHSRQDQAVLSSVQRIYVEAFSHYPQYAAKIAEFLKFSTDHDFDIVLLIAEGNKNRILGFSLSFYFSNLKYAYLDYLASDPNRPMRGYGAALYESNRQLLMQAGCKGILMDVPPDDLKDLTEPARLKVNKKRMAFYERCGAYPIIGTKYESVSHKANQGYFTYLLLDNFDKTCPLKASILKKLVAKILFIKGDIGADDKKLKEIQKSITDDPVKLRSPQYIDKDLVRPAKKSDLAVLDVVITDETHQIHHLKEKGYVEKPARVDYILKGLEGFRLERKKIKHYGEKHITAVHHVSLFDFLKKSEKELAPGQLVYPNVFPIRRPDRIPRNWEMQAGYYCIDTFTPVTASAYRAARHAVDAAISGAENVLKGSQHTYVVCRPPGHHAETRAFGGFCYFNNASIAAHHLSGYGKVAFIDVDYHHGNGSQEIFYHRNDVYFISIHGHPRVSYPYFAGYSDERGQNDGKGFNRNFPLYPGTDDNTYLETLNDALGLFKRYKPDFLVVSLGLDIMAGDPTGAFTISVKGIERIGKTLGSLGIPSLIVQEGGYTLRNLRNGAAAFFKGLLS